MHRLVDELADDDVESALVLLESRVHDPVVRLLANAPVDDEPWTADDEVAVDDVRGGRAAGDRPVSSDDAKRHLGL